MDRRMAAAGVNTNSTSSCVDGHSWSTKVGSIRLEVIKGVEMQTNRLICSKDA